MQTHSLRIAFHGPLTSDWVARVRDQVETVRELRVVRLVLDLANVDQIDPTGVAFLVALDWQAKKNGGQMHVEGLTGQPARCLYALGLWTQRTANHTEHERQAA